MKKVRIIILFMTLLLGMFFFMPVKVFGKFSLEGTADAWYTHISQFDYDDYDYGLAYAVIHKSYDELIYDNFGLLIVEEPYHEFDGCYIEYWYTGVRWNHFKPSLGNYIKNRLTDDFGVDIVERLESAYPLFDGFLYWNFEEQYWQIEPYGTSELDYYTQRVDELEDEISLLEDALENNVAFDYDIVKWFVPLVIIIILVAVIKPLISIKRRDE